MRWAAGTTVEGAVGKGLPKEVPFHLRSGRSDDHSSKVSALSTVTVWEQLILVGDCPVNRGVLNSTPGLYH